MIANADTGHHLGLRRAAAAQEGACTSVPQADTLAAESGPGVAARGYTRARERHDSTGLAHVTRLPALSGASLSADQLALVMSLGGNPAHLPGPYNALLRLPILGKNLREMTTYFRTRSSLGEALSEICILAVARFLDCHYGWHAHVPVAVRHGIDIADLEKIGKHGSPRFAAARDRLAWEFSSAILRGSADDPLIAEVTSAFGEAGLVEITTLVGLYWLIFKLVEIDQVEPRASEVALLP